MCYTNVALGFFNRFLNLHIGDSHLARVTFPFRFIVYLLNSSVSFKFIGPCTILIDE